MTQRSEGFEARVLLAAIVVTIVALPAGALALRQSTANSSRIPISLLDDDVSADQDRGDTTDSAETTNEGATSLIPAVAGMTTPTRVSAMAAARGRMIRVPAGAPVPGAMARTAARGAMTTNVKGRGKTFARAATLAREEPGRGHGLGGRRRGPGAYCASILRSLSMWPRFGFLPEELRLSPGENDLSELRFVSPTGTPRAGLNEWEKPVPTRHS